MAFIEILCLLVLLEPIPSGFYPQNFKVFPLEFPKEAVSQRLQGFLSSDTHLPELLPSARSLSVLGSLCLMVLTSERLDPFKCVKHTALDLITSY